MVIAIDLNDVVRDFSRNFVKYYIEGYDHGYDLTDFEFWTNDMAALFPFKSDKACYNFMYNDYAFELYGKCGLCSRNLTGELNEWVDRVIPDIDENGDVDLMIVSPKEFGSSIGNTYYFIAKTGVKIRKIYLPMVASDIWNKCDVLITANPSLLECKPENKTSIKICTEYNGESEADYSFPSLSSFLADENNTKKLIEKHVGQN